MAATKRTTSEAGGTRPRKHRGRSRDSRSGSGNGRDTLLATFKADFDARLAVLAAEPAQWMEFIEQVAEFGARYGLSNQILLFAQAEKRGIAPRYFLPYGNRPATTGWKAVGRHVRAGEKAFKIWAPIKRRPTEDEASAWEAAGRSVAREPSGRLAVQVAGFRLADTFELSQTDGVPFEAPTVLVKRRARHDGRPRLLTGSDSTGVFDDLVALIIAAGYRFELVAPGTGYLGGANGITVNGPGIQVVQVRDDVDPAQRTKTTVHELAHIRCRHLDTVAGRTNMHRGRAETEAESVAHIVLRALDADTAAYSDAYVFGWADGDLELVKACAATVLRVARTILDDLTPTGSSNLAVPISADEPDPANGWQPGTLITEVSA